jgi:hypothetical protein
MDDRIARSKGRSVAMVIFAFGHVVAYPLLAQQPPSTVSPAYRAPAIAFVQPPPGGTVPQDRPVVLLRFAAGEPNDPLDHASFALTVDGESRHAAFQVTATEAWGSLATPDGRAPLALGPRSVTARICSSRGLCTVATASIAVVPSVVPADSATGPERKSARRRLLDALLTITRSFLTPR